MNQSASSAVPFLEVDKLTKSFSLGSAAVNNVSFGVEAGKIVTLLGPSGCGKTTTLRCIAGLETPTAGTIRIDREVVTSVERAILVPPERRNVGMVFQSYAVWPHMTVAENLAVPLQVRRVPAREIRQRVAQVLELVGLTGLEDRYANRLSGGQQQRVALARALIYRPRLLLFDEPLSNLDAKLRERMRHEIRRLQREVGITSVYVTHDQAEAMVISDRIIVMNNGRIEQEGDARTLYSRPASVFVATFLGVANLAEGTVQPGSSDRGYLKVVIQSAPGEAATLVAASPTETPSGGRVYICVRPENVLLHATPPVGRANVLPGIIRTMDFLGNLTEYQVEAAGRMWRVQGHSRQVFAVGDKVALELPPDGCLCLPHGGGGPVSSHGQPSTAMVASAS